MSLDIFMTQHQWTLTCGHGRPTHTPPKTVGAAVPNPPRKGPLPNYMMLHEVPGALQFAQHDHLGSASLPSNSVRCMAVAHDPRSPSRRYRNHVNPLNLPVSAVAALLDTCQVKCQGGHGALSHLVPSMQPAGAHRRLPPVARHALRRPYDRIACEGFRWLKGEQLRHSSPSRHMLFIPECLLMASPATPRVSARQASDRS